MNEKNYGILSGGSWWRWFDENGDFTHRLSKEMATEACEMLRLADDSIVWEVKLIGDNGLAIDLPEVTG